MKGLADVEIIRSVLGDAAFSFKKSLGQNFLVDPSVCPRMAEAAGQGGASAVLEIGPGIGVLTNELADRFDKVVAIELDERLRPVLAKTLGDHDNVEILFGDALDMNLAEVIDRFSPDGKIAVCANLPYYITSPLVMKLLTSGLRIESITVMVQREAAERLTADIGSREAGAVSVAVQYYASAETLFEVPRESFLPSPNVDSAVMKLILREKPPVEIDDADAFFRFVKAAFGLRRKTMVNSLSGLGGYGKETVSAALDRVGLSPTVRAEALSLDRLAAVYRAIKTERTAL